MNDRLWSPQLRKWARDSDRHGMPIGFYRSKGEPRRFREAGGGQIYLSRTIDAGDPRVIDTPSTLVKLFTLTPTSIGTGFANVTLRATFPAASLSHQTDTIRLTFRTAGASTNDIIILGYVGVEGSFGPASFDGTQIPITVDGVQTVALLHAIETITTDWMRVPNFTAASTLVVSTYFSGTTVSVVRQLGINTISYTLTGNDAGTTDAIGYTTLSAGTRWVLGIEGMVSSPPGLVRKIDKLPIN